MKKLIPFLTLFLSSCYYYTQPVPRPVYTYGTYYQSPPQRNCQCGYVLDKGVDDWGYYFLDVQNQCSGNVKRFTFSKSDWTQYKISDGICLERNSSW
jgi:hypothetical protein